MPARRPNGPGPLPRLGPKYVERFWSKVAVGGKADCWDWTQGTVSTGGGVYKVVIKRGVYRMVRASRLAYLLGTGSDPGSMVVRHRCSNNLCCNPEHLYLGTRAEVMEPLHHPRPGPGSRSRAWKPGLPKLSAAQIRAIRRRAEAGESARALARRYGVDHRTVASLLRGQSWAQVK